MSSADPAPAPVDVAGPIDERDRELLDHLIDLAWRDALSALRRQVENANQPNKRAA